MEDTIAAGSNNNFIVMANWFAPSPLFIFVNIVIGSIALATRFNAKPPKKQFQQQQQLFQRVKSFNLNHYHYNQNQPKSVTQNDSDQYESTQPQLVQKTKPSLLERVVSFKLNKQRKTHYAQAESEHPWMKPVKSKPVKLKPVCDEEEEEEEKSKVEMTMKRSASEKECSMTFDWEEEDEETVERRRPATAMARSETTTCEEDEGVDSKADDFINMFKKQLRLQRLDSFIRYRNTL